MPKQILVKSAKTDIWVKGLGRVKTHQKGKKVGQPYTTVDRSQPHQDGDEILIKKGEPYYWTKYKYQLKRISKIPFTQDQLRYGRYGKPEYQEKYEEFESKINDLDEEDEDSKDELRTEIEEYRDELQGRLDSMPEALQESSILNERITDLEDLVSQIDNL